MFKSLHESILSNNELVERFTVPNLRRSLVQMYENFCKVAHPTEKKCIFADAFPDRDYRYIIHSIGAVCDWKTTTKATNDKQFTR